MDLTNATNRIAAQGELVTKIKEEVGKVIVGQEKLIDRLVLALVTDGHILLEGVPGLAKTLSVNTLARATFTASGSRYGNTHQPSAVPRPMGPVCRA